ncbi:MAG: cupin domain-containing protein [Rhizobiaceae bacterium]
MAGRVEKYRLDSPEGGIHRKLAKGLTTTIFSGEKAMLSVVTIEPGAMGVMHSHAEEQWGVVLEGSATRYQDDLTFEIVEGDFFRTPPHAKHTMKAGSDGVRVLDIFAPVREEYLKPGEGFGGG